MMAFEGWNWGLQVAFKGREGGVWRETEGKAGGNLLPNLQLPCW